MKQNATMSSKSLVFFIFTLLLLSPTSCLNPKKLPTPTDNIQGSLVGEMMTRLGSTPPSCYNKCNNCHPCMAVQVPTVPSNHQLRPPAIGGAKSAAEAATMDNYYDPSPYSPGGNNRYSNYKPLGWKCRCGGHFYNP